MKNTWRKVLEQGSVAGLIGFAAVAVIFAALNLAQGKSPFYTAALLGASLFYGATDPAQVAVAPASVFAYNGLHLVVFLIFGLAASALALMADQGKHLWYVGLFFFMFISFHLEGFVQALSYPMRQAIPDMAVWGAGIAASLAMAAYILSQHPRIRAPQPWDG